MTMGSENHRHIFVLIYSMLFWLHVGGKTQSVEVRNDEPARSLNDAVYDICRNATVTGTSGGITSPNHPGYYENNLDCAWTIQGPENTRIAIRFNSPFDVEEASSCVYDYIQFNNGSRSERICGRNLPRSLLFVSNVLTIRFRTDGSVIGTGFSLNWTAVDASVIPMPQTYDFTSDSGVITSPGYPHVYGNFVQVTWHIQVTSNKVIQLNFTSSVDIESDYGTNCPYDVLMINYTYNSTNRRLDDRNLEICGRNRTVETRIYPTNEMAITFLSDMTISGSGFRLEYTGVDVFMCTTPLYLNQTSGTISTPFYPEVYEPNLHCEWHITVPEDMLIVVRFEDFDVGNYYYYYSYEDCRYNDFLVIHDGNNTNARKVFDQNICGRNADLRGFESSTNQLLITFTSDSSDYWRAIGFKLNWTSVAACATQQFRCWDGACIQETRKCDGVIDCADKSDEIECAHHTSTCGAQDIAPQFDWAARIFGGSKAVNGSWPWQVYLISSRTSTNPFCGGTIINEKWVLTSAYCVSYGYSNIYVAVGAHSLTGGRTVISVSMAIKHELYYSYSSGYDIGLLRLSQNVQYGTYVRPICLLNVSESQPEVGETCVVTGWGGSRTSNSVDELRQVRVPLVSSKLCNSTHYYRLSTTFCAGLYDTGGADACWVDRGGPLVCLRNETWVQYGIISYGSNCARAGRPRLYTNVSSFTNWIDKAIHFENCESFETQVGTFGEITLPTIGGNYLPYTNCSWLLRGPANTLLNVRFEHFDTADNYGTCNEDYVIIYDGNSSDSRKVFDEPLCGRNRNIRGFESSGNEVLITFNSNYRSEASGFKLNWTAVAACTHQQFRCWDGTCIGSSQKCDGTEDCADKSDEIECTNNNSIIIFN